MIMPFPDKKYSIIYADPPWKYKDSCHAGKRGAVYKYPCMSIEDILGLPVKDIAANNAVLFLWVTAPFIPYCQSIMEAWGFQYKTKAFNWVKRNRKSPEGWFWGMGGWTRANAEDCFLGVKGKPKRISAGVHSIIECPVLGHSHKPDEAKQKIVKLMGDLPRIELFAREQTPGWDVWGNEVD